jgi:hypothetical protein
LPAAIAAASFLFITSYGKVAIFAASSAFGTYALNGNTFISLLSCFDVYLKRRHSAANRSSNILPFDTLSNRKAKSHLEPLRKESGQQNKPASKNAEMAKSLTSPIAIIRMFL